MNVGVIDKGKRDKIDSRLSYSPSLEAAVNLILGDPAFVGGRATPTFKLLRAARFLKDSAPHVFQIHKMGTVAENDMDRWLWDLLD
jgi:hypothetical protein